MLGREISTRRAVTNTSVDVAHVRGLQLRRPRQGPATRGEVHRPARHNAVKSTAMGAHKRTPATRCGPCDIWGLFGGGGTSGGGPSIPLCRCGVCGGRSTTRWVPENLRWAPRLSRVTGANARIKSLGTPLRCQWVGTPWHMTFWKTAANGAATCLTTTRTHDQKGDDQVRHH